MARDFSKSTSNLMLVGTGTFNALLSGVSKIAVHAWVYADTLNTGANDNRAFGCMINGVSTGLTLSVSGSAGAAKARVIARSQAADTLQGRSGTTTLGTGAWHAIGGLVDIAGDTITPYANGVAENGGAATFGAATYTPGTPTQQDAIGASNAATTTAEQFDGRIEWVTIWTFDASTEGLNANAFAALAAGRNPMRVRPLNLVFCMPMWGIHAPELDIVSSKLGAITGSVPWAPGAPVEPYSRRLWAASAQVPASGNRRRRALVALGA